MAKYRLYITDKTTGDKICLAKSTGHGWHLLDDEKFSEWLLEHDLAASVGNFDEVKNTSLVISAEEET